MDIRLFFWINRHHDTLLDAVLRGLSASAQFYLIWLSLGILALFLDAKNGSRTLIALFLTLFFTYLSVELVLKPLVARPRPFAALEGVRLLGGMGLLSGYSFPSGHCASSAAAAWVLGASYRRFRLPLGLVVGLIAYSRVYLGVHYPSDCVAGVAVGILCGALSWRICLALAARSRHGAAGP